MIISCLWTEGMMVIHIQSVEIWKMYPIKTSCSINNLICHTFLLGTLSLANFLMKIDCQKLKGKL
uniref:Uncharacterized protein n=1 Tax=Arundo donax TaxID=35708 RepID=A0A0A9E3V8_ARUDO